MFAFTRREHTLMVFALPDSDSYADSETDSYGIGCYCFLKKSVQWTYTNSYSDKVVMWSNFHSNFALESPSELVPV